VLAFVERLAGVDILEDMLIESINRIVSAGVLDLDDFRQFRSRRQLVLSGEPVLQETSRGDYPNPATLALLLEASNLFL